jgi:hypothetical protein
MPICPRCGNPEMLWSEIDLCWRCPNIICTGRRYPQIADFPPQANRPYRMDEECLPKPHVTKPPKPVVMKVCAAAGCTNEFPSSYKRIYCTAHNFGRGVTRIMPTRVWTPDKVAELRGLLESGLTPKQCAEKFHRPPHVIWLAIQNYMPERKRKRSKRGSYKGKQVTV